MSDMFKTRVQDILAKLVAFDTTSHKSNIDLIEYVEGYLAEHGIASQRISNPGDSSKACLWATIGPAGRSGYILSGHTDVVPVTGQAWSSDPFTLREHNGLLYGRGTADMKGFIAACLAMVPDMTAAKLAVPLHFAFSFDEEVGCKGVRPMLAKIVKLASKPLGCFVGEPTMMDVIIGHKGKHAMKAIFRGLACHSSLAPYGVNAIEHAADLIKLVQLKAYHLAAQGSRDPLHEIPYSTGLTSTIQGGLALNIVPEYCEVDFEFRAISGEDPKALTQEVVREAQEKIVPRMKHMQHDCGIEFREIFSYPSLDIPPDAPLVTLAKQLSRKNRHFKVAYGTEAGLFVEIADIPTVVIGPGSIEQAHKPDEYIALSQLVMCGEFIGRLIDHCG